MRRKPCVIIGNGPSLNDVPLDFLNKYKTFGTNRVYLKYIPDYYVATNPLVLQQFRSEIDALPCEKFLRGAPLRMATQHQFSHQPLDWVYEGYTVTFVCLQLAYWMSYKTVLLVGLDHRYTFDGRPNEKRVLTGDDPNHFDPAYFRGCYWHNPDLKQAEASYRLALEAFEADGRRIINLTPGTALDVFEKGDINDWCFE